MTEDYRRMAAIDLIVLGRIEKPPHRRLHSEGREIVTGNELCVYALRLVADAKRCLYSAAADDVRKRLPDGKDGSK